MEFRRIRVGAFGALRDLETGPEPLTRLVGVLGPNEAGKSTLFHFLTSMLYGFYPASRDRNPYTPWEGGDIEGRAWLRLEDGEVLEVHRRLLSSPSASLVRGTTSEDLRNRTLPFAEHVPREVFRQVFALTLAELTALEGESWERVQDRLVTGMGASDLASIRSAAEELEREAGRLWRPSRMGNQRVRDLRERLRELRLRRRTASDADRKLREAARERDRVARELRNARRERQACHLYVERCQTLLPSRDRLRRIDELLEEAGPPDELEGLPADPEGTLSELEAEAADLRERRRALDREAAEPRGFLDAFGAEERATLERAGRIREAVARAAGSEPFGVRAARLRQELRDLARRRDDLARELLASSWDEAMEEALRAVPGVRLRTAVQEYRDAREARRLAEEAASLAEEAASRAGFREGVELPGWLGPGLTLPGGVLLVVAAILGWTLAAIVAAVVTGMGGALLLVRRTTRRDPVRRSEEASRERLREARAAEEAARTLVSDLLSQLPVRDDLLERPPADLGVQLQRLQELVGDARDRREQLDEVRARLAAVADTLDRLAEDLGVEASSDAAVTAHRLEARLREAETAAGAAASARKEVERIDRERAALDRKLEGALRARDELRGRLAELARPAEDGLWAGVAVKDRLEARDRARRLREELERDHPDLEELRQRIRRVEESEVGWGFDAETLAARKVREAELAEEIEGLARRLEGLEKDMDYLGRESTVGAVDGEIEAVRNELDAAIRARDRLWVLAAVLREADRRFRDEHQPDILRRAGCHLAAITGGRYGKILLDEGGEGRFLLQGPGYPGPVEVGEPISTGTREQVYLALRAAILDHLDRSGERLPLFMDEAFVNWDEARRERGFGLLEEMTRTRQVFVFTCHEAMAGSLADRGARILSLDAAG